MTPFKPLALLLGLALGACQGATALDADGKKTMTPSTTYLHLLRHTPFFTALSTHQLRWVIEHSAEWRAEAGAVIARSTSAPDYWVLLDGGWELVCGERHYPSGHGAPGKWFNPALAKGQDCALITTTGSYVMRILASDMNAMLASGFAFEGQLQAGRDFYTLLFDTALEGR
ncbi:hypothetical protein [Gallaecimonas pentaromativorans]|uniref:Uncharacterized protein n=1 Tax=Gallaecimonas pentaromativorans TaxID=584787 RepID=A0A3N1PDC6_9GAMM|nr:hypothetical protein [Gallaecimonas pentaromativorans]ROQ25828.1 hypothetical protein EDC28_105138 [Gallaecimonas pentaromativorans]